jgi:hypothetical protein
LPQLEGHDGLVGLTGVTGYVGVTGLDGSGFTGAPGVDAGCGSQKSNNSFESVMKHQIPPGSSSGLRQ